MLLNFLLTYSNLYGFIGRASPVLDTDAEAPEFDSGMRNIIIPRDYPLYRRDLRLNPSYIAQQR